ncbi:hypothetical protein PCANC_09423 [Puccinia coronata f. sp. avenae]|uniref:Fanconi-associated nuclease n=1 Tax=Puccinia coronata f. sp. avenae TaxID=200324 RepID=A0A2N5SUC8_9BASI|nr:hypothetical protein PCANC_09423 [Puccinia coronata f. sp. avenae]
MSSPHQGIVSLDSCSSSSSESSSSAYSTVSPNQSSSKNKGRRRTSHTKKKKKKHNDKFLISANQWTPIVGAPVPKINKKTTEKRNPQETLVDPITHAKLVNLFEPSSHVSSARSEEDVSLSSHPTDQEVQQPILVTIEEKVSLYVNCFEEMLNTVLRYEAFLFLPSELRILSSWQALPHSSKYLFVRLFMRKHDNWFRLDKLNNYALDIGDIQEACLPLCKLVEDLLEAMPANLAPLTPQDSSYGEQEDDVQYPAEKPAIHLDPFLAPGSSLIHASLDQLNPQFNPRAGINDFQYAAPHPSITDPELTSSGRLDELYQLNPQQTTPWGGMNDTQCAVEEPVISIGDYIFSSPPEKLGDQFDPQTSARDEMKDVQYTLPEPDMTITNLFRPSSTATSAEFPYNPFEEVKHPGVDTNTFLDPLLQCNPDTSTSLDDLLQCNPDTSTSFDQLLQYNPSGPAMCIQSPEDLLQDLELAINSRFVSSNPLPPSIPSKNQLSDPASQSPVSATVSIKTDEAIMPQLTRFMNRANQTEEEAKWSHAAYSLSHSLNEVLDVPQPVHSPELGRLPFDVYDSHALPNLPPIPRAVDIPLPVTTGAPDLIPPTPRDSSPPISVSDESEKDPELRSFAAMACDEHAFLNTDDLFACMNLDELKGFAKKLRVNSHTTKDMIILGIKAATCKQSTLCGAPSTRKGKQKKQLSLKFTNKGLKEILKIIGPAIKLRPKVCSLFKRLHLIFYRSTTISEKTMTASMLARMNLRNYPAYEVIRTDSIFDSRDHLLKYEEALELEKKFDDLLVNERKSWDEDEQGKARRQEAKTLRLRKALDVFESAWLHWQQAVMEEDDRLEQLRLFQQQLDELDYDRRNYYKRRFHQGWPLTRILQKGLAVLARFKEHEREVQVLEALIRQRHFRRGRRGQWYDRLALVLMSHLATKEPANSESRRFHEHSALYTCQHGIDDPDTHQLHRFSLTRRLVKLQALFDGHDPSLSSLEVPLVEDWKAARRTVIHRSLVSDNRESGVKTLWISSLDNTPVTVEEIALQHYLTENPQWRGFHSETGILKMIFSLVFWDVIFAPVPGAFETAFQTAPLDMATDAFRIVRGPLIEERIRMIEDEGSAEIAARLRETYTREWARKTWAVGIGQHSWERYTLQDLEEIVLCFSVPAFVLISRVFFEDWSVWTAGAPDLCLWNLTRRLCKFVEVKGPGDKLSEQQKNWFSLLLKAEGIQVEICSVKEEEE